MRFKGEELKTVSQRAWHLKRNIRINQCEKEIWVWGEQSSQRKQHVWKLYRQLLLEGICRQLSTAGIQAVYIGEHTFLVFVFWMSIYIVGLPLWFSQQRIHLQCRRPRFDPWVGKIPWRRERLPTPVFWPGEFHGLYSPWGLKELDTTERLSLSFIHLVVVEDEARTTRRG